MFFVGRIGHGFGHGGHHRFGYGGFGHLGAPFCLGRHGHFGHHHHGGAGLLLGAAVVGGAVGGFLSNLFSGASQSPMSTALQGPPTVS